MMRRTIGFLVTLALGLLVAPLAAEAQPAGHVSRIGLLLLGSSSSFSSRLAGFRQELRDLGWVEGQRIALEERYAENLDQLPALAANLVRLPVALILAGGAANALAAQQATPTLPIVFVGVANPIGRGLVPNCRGLQTAALKPANKSGCGLTFHANKRRLGLTIAAKALSTCCCRHDQRA